jgi:soluble cytochrome b562
MDELEKEVAELKQILKQKDEKREQEFTKLQENMSEYEQEIIKLKESVRELEQEMKDFFSCQMCGFVDNLNVCYSCCKKVCRYCHTIKETKDCHEDVIFRCLCSNCV